MIYRRIQLSTISTTCSDIDITIMTGEFSDDDYHDNIPFSELHM